MNRIRTCALAALLFACATTAPDPRPLYAIPDSELNCPKEWYNSFVGTPRGVDLPHFIHPDPDLLRRIRERRLQAEQAWEAKRVECERRQNLRQQAARGAPPVGAGKEKSWSMPSGPAPGPFLASISENARPAQEEQANTPKVPEGWPNLFWDTDVLAPFLECRSPSAFIRLQRGVDMAALVERLDPWYAVQLGSLGPLLDGRNVLDRKRAEYIIRANHDYGTPRAEVLTLYIFLSSFNQDIREGAPEANAGQTKPPQEGGKVLRFPQKPRSGPQPEAGAQPKPSEERAALAPTGTDGQPNPARRGSGSSGESPHASLKPSRRAPAPSPPPSPPVSPPATTYAAPGPGESGTGGRMPGAAQTGPGQWVAKNESMSANARLYQSQITHQPPGMVYRVENVKMPNGEVKEVKFDGFEPGKELQECKGPGYDQFLDPKRPGHFQWWFEYSQEHEDNGMVSQARKQLQAANGLPVRWYVAEAKAADAIRELFRENDVKVTDVIYKPFISPDGAK